MTLQRAPIRVRAQLLLQIRNGVPWKDLAELDARRQMLDRNYLRNRYQTDLSSERLLIPVRIDG